MADKDDDRRSDEPTPEEVAAWVARDNAEAEKHKAEADTERETARKVAAEARKLDAEAREAELKALIAQYTFDREAEKRQRELSHFSYQRVYHFTSAVGDESCTKCMNELNYWHSVDPKCDIEILFDSPGGSVFAGMALYDYIQDLRKTHHVTTSTRGMAASMGGILLQAGDHRVMGAEAFILIHEISTFTAGKVGDIEDTMKLLKKMEDRVLNIFASRSKLTKARLKANWRRTDWWIDSTEALKFGLVDEVR